MAPKVDRERTVDHRRSRPSRSRSVRAAGPGEVRSDQQGGASFNFRAPRRPLTGDPGDEVADCVGARVIQRGNKKQVVLTFEFDGGVANQWLQIGVPLSPWSKYVRQAQIALGDEYSPGMDLDPHDVFVGKRLKVRVGFRKTEHAGGSGRSGDDLALRRKDDQDQLRVHEILELIGLTPEGWG